jgi:multiple sugar transport system substrate-binding protein
MLRRVLCFILICIYLTSCTNKTSVSKKIVSNNTKIVKSNYLNGTNFQNLDLPKNYNLRQFEGMTLNFIIENNLSANILTHESEEFSKVTGINVKIKAVDFDTLVQKINLDFIAEAGKYQIVYVDPYQTLNRFYKYLEILNPYNKNKALPQIKGFPDDFFGNQTTVCSYFIDNKNLYAVPFDTTTMILYYRKDIFDKYKDKFYKEMGYDWTPGKKGFTWKKYYQIAKWINKNVPKKEVEYGSGLMAEEHDSIFCEFSDMLASYGGDYFSDKNISTYGLKTFDKINVLNKNFMQALNMYKKVASVSAPQSVNWNWTDLANSFRNGEIAMMSNWDENSTYLEDAVHSKIAGKIGYSMLPYGDVRSANIYGGSGIGINKYATEREKQAAWLYIVWATSKETQLKILKHPEGGSLPTMKSAYNDPTIIQHIQNPEMISKDDVLSKHINAVLNAWKPENIYLRPKISNFFAVEKVLVSNLHNMIKLNLNSKKVSKSIYDELEQIKADK